MASQGARIWLPNTEDFFNELVQFAANAEQNRMACDSSDFYCRRLEEYQGTLNVLTRRIAESFPMERHLLNNLEILLNYLNNLGTGHNLAGGVGRWKQWGGSHIF